MEKPQKQNHECYDYNECVKYIEAKRHVDIRDYDNKYGKNGNLNNEYQDFWHYLIDNYTPGNGCIVSVCFKENYDNMEPWQKQIAQWFDEEFADKEGCIDFYTWW